MEIEKGLRYRINVTTSVKGVKTWEATVDATGYTMLDVVAESDNLVAELEKRYPAPVDEKKKE